MVAIRQLKREEYHACAGMLSSSEYYDTIRPNDLIGTDMVGVFDGDNEVLVGCAMVLVSGPQAYVDYFYINPLFQNEGVGRDLANYIVRDLCVRGVAMLHACINSKNAVMQQMVARYKPKIGWPYTNVVINLERNNDGN